jgi:hypothetical protein
MLLAGLGNMLPAMTISDIPAMVHQPQIASIVVQAVAIDMITLLFSSIAWSASAFIVVDGKVYLLELS